MAVARHDALLGGPRTFGVVLEKVFVVVGFDDECLRLLDPLARELGCEAEVGQETQHCWAVVEHEADWVHRVVRHAEGLHGDVFDLKIGAGDEDAPVFCERGRLAFEGFGGERVCVDGCLKIAAPNVQPARVIAVLVGEENAIEFLRVDAAQREPLADLQAAQSPIDQDASLGRLDEGAIARAAAAEDGEMKHRLCFATRRGAVEGEFVFVLGKALEFAECAA